MNVDAIIKVIEIYIAADIKFEAEGNVAAIGDNIKSLIRLFAEVWCEVGSYNRAHGAIIAYRNNGDPGLRDFLATE